MNTNTKAIQDLNIGEAFTLSSSRGTVYVVEGKINSDYGYGTTIDYSFRDFPGEPMGTFTKPGLTTATLV